MAKKILNYFKHVPDDLVITTWSGMVISVLGTLLMVALFIFELQAFLTVKATTSLVVDELIDETLRVNFNVTLLETPCEYVSIDVSDMTGGVRHNITKDILKWRLDSRGKVTGKASTTHSFHEQHGEAEKHDLTAYTKTKNLQPATAVSGQASGDTGDHVFLDDEAEPADTNLSQSLTKDTFESFLQEHELTLVNYFAPWCIWCRRLEPVYLQAAAKVPTLHFHGHARLAQVDCVANQDFCTDSHIRAYPTLRMYKDGDPVSFELFTGSRTVEDILDFIQTQMTNYKRSVTVTEKKTQARFVVKHGALTAGNDLYRAQMDEAAAQLYCGNNKECAGFTWVHQKPDPHSSSPSPPPGKPSAAPAVDSELPTIFFKGRLSIDEAHAAMNHDATWSSYIKLTNATADVSAPGSLLHGPEGCRIAGHIQVRKVPGALKFLLHSVGHDHVKEMINTSHVTNEFWFGEPLTRHQRLRLRAGDERELMSPTSHRLDGLPFLSKEAGHAHVHYLKVVTKVLQLPGRLLDVLAYKYTVHSNKYEASAEPSIEFKYDLSPISIVVTEEKMPAYKFLTSSCAIIGGVFTVIGLIESVVHHTSSAISKKQI